MQTRAPAAWLRVNVAVIDGGPPPVPAFTEVTVTVSSLLVPGLKTSFVPAAICHGHPVLGFTPAMVGWGVVGARAVTPFSVMPGGGGVTEPGLLPPLGTMMAGLAMVVLKISRLVRS